MSFVGDLELSTAYLGFVNDNTAKVGAAQAIGFPAGIDSQTKEDVMNSHLLAQLVASKQCDRFTEANRWYNLYKSTLENIGWVMTNTQNEHQNLSDTPISVDKLVIDYLRKHLNDAQLSLIVQVIFAIEKSNDAAVKVFTSSSTEEHRAHFQLGACAEDGDKNTILSLGGFDYSTNETISNPLTTKIEKGSAEFNSTYQTLILNREIYSHMREAVINKLGHYIKDLIHELVLPHKN